MVKPDTRHTPSEDEFTAWTEHPITRYVAAAWLTAANAQREAWTGSSWATGEADPMALKELRTRADAYMAFLETGLKDYANILAQAEAR